MIQKKDEHNSTVKKKSEIILVYMENNLEKEVYDYFKVASEHKEQEPVKFEVSEVCQSIREGRPLVWHSEYITNINVAYYLPIEDEESSIFHKALNNSDVTL